MLTPEQLDSIEQGAIEAVRDDGLPQEAYEVTKELVQMARRYAWLRETKIGPERTAGRFDVSFTMSRLPPNAWVLDNIRGDELDAAIDQAIANEK